MALYDAGELALPAGSTLHDLEWLGFCWDLDIETGGGTVCRFLLTLAPRTLMYWYEDVNDLDMSEYDNMDIIVDSELYSRKKDIMSKAQEHTEWMMGRDCELTVAPFAVDFTVPGFDTTLYDPSGESYRGYSVHTLGDAVARASDGVRKRLISHVRSVHPSSPVTKF